jgi:outer membrane protein assembly factor BamD (BamD/ComL family)
MKSRITISLLLLSMFVVTGCISKSLEEAQVDFCQALVAYGEAARELQNVNASTAVEELQSAVDDVADARDAVGDAAVDLREARIRSAENAWENTQEVILVTEIERIGNISCGRR